MENFTEETVLQTQTELIREVFFYTNRYRASTFVVYISPLIIASPHFPTLVRDLSLLQKNGIRLALVPGASTHIDAILKNNNIVSQHVNGIRISHPDHMPLIKMAAFDIANIVMTQCSRHNIDAVIGNWINARSLGVHDGIDYLDTGIISKINIDLLCKVMDDGFIPILPCIGWSRFGKPYNLSSFELSTHLASKLQANKLFFLTNNLMLTVNKYQLPEDGCEVCDNLISRLTSPAAEHFLKLNPMIHDGNLHLLRCAVQACKDGVDRVHILDGNNDGVILKEIFSTIGQGTMIHRDPFENIRPMRLEDVSEILYLMTPSMESGILIKRDEEFFQEKYHDFVVFEADSTIRGCGALHVYSNHQAEIAGIATNPSSAYLGVGKKIIAFLIERARHLGTSRVFLLTTQSGDYFENLGFHPTSIDSLPPEKKSSYNLQRRSRVYQLKL